MELRFKNLPKDVWVRTCQECGNTQVEHFAPTYGKDIPDSYRNRKCKKCHSEALDYGSENYELDENES